MSIKSNRFDDIKVGIIIGAILPAIGVLLYYYVHQAMPNEKIDGLTYDQYLKMLQRPKLLSTILRAALIMNLGGFFLALNFEWTQISRGIITVTLIYALLIVYLHFA